MTSHKEYIKDQNEDQLRHLIEVASQRLTDIENSGWVTLLVVFDHTAQGCFSQDDYEGAVMFLTRLAQKYIASGKAQTLSIEKRRYRPNEASDLLAETKEVLEKFKINLCANESCAAAKVMESESINPQGDKAKAAFLIDKTLPAGTLLFARTDITKHWIDKLDMPVKLAERLIKTLTDLGYATPTGIESFNADLEMQLNNLCRGVENILSKINAVKNNE